MSSSLSEVETMDTLPFVTDVSLEKPKIVAPSIEEVDEDPDTLRSLRGQGRYFGGDDNDNVIKEALPKCNNCSQRGHLKKNCPHVICTYCGLMDDHYSQHCPKAIKCANCNENGHYRSQCPHKWKRTYCALCNSKKHSRERCPSIWRVYLLKDDANEKISLPLESVFCYNCGSKGHFGDDCDLRRSSRVPNEDGSAFSGDNLAPSLKSQYFENLDILSNKRNHEFSIYDSYNNNDNRFFSYDDYEYDESLYDDVNRNNNNTMSKKRRRQDNNNNSNSSGSSNSSRKKKTVQPHQRGKTLQPSRDKHPLDFPRNPHAISENMNGSRYGSTYHNRNNGQYEQQPSNYKNYNSFKPFRSGVLRR